MVEVTFVENKDIVDLLGTKMEHIYNSWGSTELALLDNKEWKFRKYVYYVYRQAVGTAALIAVSFLVKCHIVQ